MARLARQTHNETLRTKMISRIRQFFVLILSAIIGFLVSISVNAQPKPRASVKTMHDYSDPCSVLEKKRKQKSASHTFRFSDRRRIQSSINETRKGIIEKRSDVAEHFPSPAGIQQHIIREMVATYLKETPGGQPIDLAPLKLILIGDGFAVDDVNPFLIAAEFALQGKTIGIWYPASQLHGADGGSHQLARDIQHLMVEMGVPEERISIVENADIAAHHASGGRDDASRKVQFMVL